MVDRDIIIFGTEGNTIELMHHILTDLPDVVRRLCLVDYSAACWTPVVVEEVLHDAAFANLEKINTSK